MEVDDVEININYSKRGVMVGPEKWLFKQVYREKILGSEKYIYIGNLYDPTGEKKELRIAAKNINGLRRQIKKYILRWI